MEARPGIRSESVSVLVAWAESAQAEAASRIATEAFRQAFGSASGDVPARLRTGLAAAEQRLRAAAFSRRVRPGRLGSALVGIGAVVVERDRAWTLSRGDVDAYLLRDARLTWIGRTSRAGDPGRAPAPPQPDRQGDVLRTSLAPGDTLLLASRDLLRVVGAEELKSAALTLHPIAAVAHLRRLFATCGGRGSDAALPIDITVSAQRDLGAGAIEPPSAPIPIARSTVPPARRAALGLASFGSVIAIVALLVVLLPRGNERVAAQQRPMDGPVAEAIDLVTRADEIAASEASAAIDLYRAGWDVLADADPEREDPDVLELATRITSGLDALRGGGSPSIRLVDAVEAHEGDLGAGRFARGPDGDLYLIDDVASVVTRVDPDDGDRIDIAHRGDRGSGGGERIGRPVQLERAGSALLIVDDDARLWRWEPSEKRRGRMTALELGEDVEWSPSIGDVATHPDPNGFRVYLVDAVAQNILRFQPTFDGRSFMRSDYLVVDDEAVAGFRQLHIDERVYALTDEGIRRYEFGRTSPFRLGLPPDDADIRPGQDYRIVAGADRAGTSGHLYLYDAAWDRIVVFDKEDGSYVRQWTAPQGDPSMRDMLALSVTTGTRKRPDTLHWLTPTGIYEAVVPWTTADPDEAAEGAETRREGRRKARSR